ncbi:pirin family protein [Sphaerotilus sp.]|uniref:pirin family protein n=1 Tax=Sphaerotilus sp. TaxID=2093942 RepID=UPI00286DE2E6|nr:pirin family protein [Sphaerotilus sp.]
MITLRPSLARGHAQHGWLDSFHSFSFADYHDPAHMGWGNLRVINDDRIAAHTGFGMHGHRDMEIVTYLLAGELEHKDSMGNGETIRTGEVQRMSAGTGVRHSEFNHSGAQTHLLQIWLLPAARDLPPSYDQQVIAAADKRGRLHAVAAPVGADDAAQATLQLNADARLWAGLFDGDESATLALDPARKAYVHLARGRLTVNGHALVAGDALLLAQESVLTVGQGDGAEVLVFDLEA